MQGGHNRWTTTANFGAARHINDTTVLHKITLPTVKPVMKCMQADSDHSEHLLNSTEQYLSINHFQIQLHFKHIYL